MHAPPRDAVGVKAKQHRRGGVRGDSIPTSLQSILDSFESCFSRPSLENFAALVSGWILCPGRHCISRVIQLAGGVAATRHFSTLYRFLSRSRWSADELGRVVFQLLRRHLPRDIEVLVDDTLCRHGGPRIFGIAMHHDAVRSSYGRGTTARRATLFSCGHCWVVLAVRVPLPWDRDRGIAVPVLFRLYRSKKRCDKRSYRKRTELAAELVSLIESWIPAESRLSVAGDGEYASKTLVRRLAPQTNFVGPVVMDAALYDPPPRYAGRGRPRKVGARLRSPQQLCAAQSVPWRRIDLTMYGRRVKLLVKTQVCLWHTVAGSRLVKIVVTRDPARRAQDRAYFSADPRLRAEEILERFARRWLLEVCFRDAKQWLGIQDPQNGWSRGTRRSRKRAGPQPRGRRGQLAVLRTLPIGFTACAIVVLWYLRHGEQQRDVSRARGRAPWYRQKRAPAFADMLVALRREIWAARLSAHPGLDRLPRKLVDLLPQSLLAA